MLLVHILMMMLKKNMLYGLLIGMLINHLLMVNGGVWQYSEKGKVNRISGYVDTNHGNINYENIIKKGHYNGY